MDSRRTDPLQILPYEPWVKCMKLYARDQPEGPLPLLAVSDAWQTTLTGTPELWTTVYFNGGHDEECRAECFFHLSKPLPLEVVIDLKSDTAGIIVKYKDRIRSLVIKNTLYRSPLSDNPALDLPGNLTSVIYQNLVEIFVEPEDWKRVLSPRILRACPSLVSIHGANVQAGDISDLPSFATEIGIVGDGDLPEGVGNRLEIMRVRRDFTSSKDHRYPKYFTGPTTRLRCLQLISSQEEDVTVDSRPLIRAFTTTSHYGLNRLSMTMAWYEFSEIIPFISVCTSLRELELFVDCDMKAPRSSEFDPPSYDMGHIRTLCITSRFLFWKDRSHARDSILHILRMVTASDRLDSLEELRLVSPSRLEIPLLNLVKLLQATTRLKELHFTGLTAPGPSEESRGQLLSSLRVLTLDNRGDFSFIEAPNLVRLQYRTVPRFSLHSSLARKLTHFDTTSSFFYKWCRSLTMERPDQEPFPQLSDLELSPLLGYHPPDHPAFSSLGSISFEGKRGDVGFDITTAYSALHPFMLEMLLSPATCPQMHTIRTTTYPNWALVAALFHQRSSLICGAAQISLWLPRYPHTIILELLAATMCASMKDANTHVASAVKMDHIIYQRWRTPFFKERNCQACIMSGFVACEPDLSSGEKLDPELPSDPVIMKLLSLGPEMSGIDFVIPHTRDEWETHLEQTATTTGAARKGPISRMCKRHYGGGLVHISPYTLVETTYDNF